MGAADSLKTILGTIDLENDELDVVIQKLMEQNKTKDMIFAVLDPASDGEQTIMLQGSIMSMLIMTEILLKYCRDRLISDMPGKSAKEVLAAGITAHVLQNMMKTVHQLTGHHSHEYASFTKEVTHDEAAKRMDSIDRSKKS